MCVKGMNVNPSWNISFRLKKKEGPSHRCDLQFLILGAHWACAEEQNGNGGGAGGGGGGESNDPRNNQHNPNMPTAGRR